MSFHPDGDSLARFGTKAVEYTIHNYSGTVETAKYAVELEPDGTWDRDYWRERILEERMPYLKLGGGWDRYVKLDFDGEEPEAEADAQDRMAREWEWHCRGRRNDADRHGED